MSRLPEDIPTSWLRDDPGIPGHPWECMQVSQGEQLRGPRQTSLRIRTVEHLTVRLEVVAESFKPCADLGLGSWNEMFSNNSYLRV